MLRRGLQQRRHEHVERAEADAQPMQRLAVGLLEMGDRAEHRLARNHPAGIGQHRRERAHARATRGVGGGRRRALAAASDGARPAASSQRSSLSRSAARLAPTSDRARARCGAPARAANGRARGARARALPRRRPAPPLSSTISAKASSGASTSAVARRSSSSPRRRSAAASSRRLSASRADGSTRNSNPDEWPIGSGPTLTSPSAATRHRQRVRAARADVADQHRGAAVDEALGQPLVKRVGQPRLDLAGALGPFGRLLQPVGAVGDIGPAADAGETVGKRLDVAAHIVEPRDFGGEPFVRDVAAFADVAEQAADHARVVHRRRPCGSREGRRPPTAAAPAAPRLRDDRRVLGDQLEHGEVDRFGRRAKQRIVALALEAARSASGRR